MSLDITKAFDNISLKELHRILQHKGAAKGVAARIIECVTEESFQTQWNGQKTTKETRRKGIKQGCPLSPYLFDLIIEDVLKKTEAELNGFFVLDQEHNIRYPIILVYADDILIIACNMQQLDIIVPILKKHLQEVNLSLNPAKTKIVVRAPRGAAPALLKVDGEVYEVSKEIKYLGVTITDRLCRSRTTKERCKKAVKSSKAVISFAKENKPSVEIGSLLYHTIISPTMIFGSQVSVITKHTRMSMRKYERQIVAELASCCVADEKEVEADQILQGKTITKKIRALQMRYWSHVIRMQDNELIKLAAKYKKNYKKLGRPAFTWLDIIKQNVDRYGDISLEEWEELARDREKVISKIEEIYDLDESMDSE